MVHDDRLHLSIDSLLEGVQIIGFDWSYLYLNRTAARHGQRPIEDLLGRTMMACYPGIEDTAMFAALRRVMESRQPAALRNEFVFADGQRRWFDLRIEPVPDGLCVLSLDVTEARETEAQLQHAQKMDALGRLAGGIVHDFNNQLTAMLGYTEMIRGRVGDDPSLVADLEEIRRACERASGLTQQLLSFTRQQVLTIEPLDLNSVVRELEQFLRRIIGEDLALEMRLAEGLWTIESDHTQLEQIVMNLLVNARDAMPDGGKLTIETANVDLTEAYVEAHPNVSPGPHVVLTVNDTGTGMDEPTRRRIFEPFFTTKEKGTGLGLSTVYGVVKQLGGDIWVYSEPGRGTTFRLYFPAARAGARTPLPAVSDAADPPRGGSERILVVEDEPDVRTVVVRVLTRHGYTVHSATTGTEAERLVVKDGLRPDLLLTDVVLPDVGGPELVERLRRLGNQRVLLMSGYGEARSVRPGAGKGAGVVQKPFTARELLRRVRAALDAGD